MATSTWGRPPGLNPRGGQPRGGAVTDCATAQCILTYCLQILLFLRQVLLLHPGRLLKDSNNGGLHVSYYLHSDVLCTDSPPRSWVLVFQ